MAQLTDHTRAEDLFSAYIDQHVTTDEQDFVERHVAVCAACRAQLHATRSMVAALKALPAVKAPRSFVLPKSMAAQPKPSIFKGYPALRRMTVIATIAFAIVFAGDLLIVRSGGSGNTIMSAPAPLATVSLAPEQAPAAAPLAKSPPADQHPLATPAPTRAALAAGNAARFPPTATATMEATDAGTTETRSADAMAAAVETTATAVMAPTVEPTPVPAVEAPAPSLTAEVSPSIDPLRFASLVLGGLVVVLGATTLIVRRGA